MGEEQLGPVLLALLTNDNDSDSDPHPHHDHDPLLGAWYAPGIVLSTHWPLQELYDKALLSTFYRRVRLGV